MSDLIDAPVIFAEGVRKSYGTNHVLLGLDCEVGSGITGLLGANGAGKSTLIGLILGLRPRHGGVLSVLGVDPHQSGPELRLRLGYAPEHHNLPGDVQAADLVQHVAQLHGLPKRIATERASNALWQVGLGEERFRPIGTMSTGQRQRVKMAQALAHDPDLLLLDEPTDGLDPVQRDAMLALIGQVGSEFGIDILLSSHLLEEIERVCDSVVILANGVVGYSGALDDLDSPEAGMRVEVDGDSQLLADVLEARGAEVSIQHNSLTVSSSATANDLIRDTVAELGMGLRRLEPHRTTLEDVFIEVSK
ncbi:MAG: ABC transporter ATP-binding protein [Acidimicrobiia bacterium]|nr:ABC transporter ATP-binding protein [Acidimicrobiia bacterium]MYC57091.1 ABC transporter ATP-binding protein [Acidimicrobiia bacterium]MYG94807.1 ABC transporter ATP-binding protein [Acidimicrobiia bacterium]MYI30168.1 ABC transporter ATP-binding protein [Acidimicrobiia bacterium]